MKNNSSIIMLALLIVCYVNTPGQTRVNGIAYKPVQGKSTGIWPTGDKWTIESYGEFKNEWGFSFLLVPAFQNQEPELSKYYNRALQSGYLVENLLIIIKDTLYQSIVENLPAAYYYLGEPVEHNCSGEPSNQYVSHIYPPEELDSIRSYIHEKQPGAEFIIDGYKRCSHLSIAGEHADRIMYSSYENWNEFTLWSCSINIGWGDDVESGWENFFSTDIQSESWEDMKNIFGDKFNMSWVDGRGDEYDELFSTANSLGLETIWFYGGSGINDEAFISFCESAVEYGWLEKVDSTVVEAPTELTAVETDEHYILLNWNDNSGVENGYTIMKKTDVSATYSFLVNLPANTTQFTDTAIIQNVQYTYRVQAYNDYTVSEFTNEASVTTIETIPSPTNLTLELDNSNNVLLIWQDNSNNENGFIIERILADEISFAVIDSVNQDEETYTDTNVVEENEYTYRLKAFNEFLESAYTDTVAILIPHRPINSPSDLLVELNQSGNVQLAWQDNSDNEEAFLIERRTVSDSMFISIDTVSQNINNFADSTVSVGTTYNYRVAAFNDYAKSEYSDTAIIAVPFEPINSPTDLSAELGDNRKVYLSWLDNSESELGFAIERKSTLDSTFIAIDSNLTDSSHFIDTTLFEDGSYNYRIFAFNNDTTSDFSNVISIDVVMTSFSGEIPSAYTNRIFQNYPNPFNPSTTIIFSIAEDCKASIMLYNMLGKEVQTIFSGSIQSGYHEIIFNGSNLSSGIYFFRIVAGNYTGTKKLVILK